MPPSLLVIRKSPTCLRSCDLPRIPDFSRHKEITLSLLWHHRTSVPFSMINRNERNPTRNRERLASWGSALFFEVLDAIYRMDWGSSPLPISIALSLSLYSNVLPPPSLSSYGHIRVHTCLRTKTGTVRRDRRCTSFQSASLRHPVIF